MCIWFAFLLNDDRKRRFETVVVLLHEVEIEASEQKTTNLRNMLLYTSIALVDVNNSFGSAAMYMYQ